MIRLPNLSQLKRRRAHTPQHPAEPQPNGFTIVELILAITIFSMVLIIMAAGITRLVQFYQASVDIRATQEAARDVSNAITEAGRQSQLITVDSSNTGTNNQPEDAVCFFTKITSHNEDGTITGNATIFHAYEDSTNEWSVVETNQDGLTSALSGGGACKHPDDSGPKIVSKSVAFARFHVSVSSDNRLAQIDMSIAGADATDPTTDVDYTATPYPTCVDGNQFCSVTDLQLAVEAREPQS